MSLRTDDFKTVHSQAGFSLIEVLVVLAIFALGTALIMPSTARMLDQTTSHAVFFEFQRQVSDLRREANRTGQSLRIIDPVAAQSQAQADGDDPGQIEAGNPVDQDRVIPLRATWTYTLAPALEIEEGGHCSTASANLLNEGRVVMSLKTEDGTCRFIRYQAEP